MCEAFYIQDHNEHYNPRKPSPDAFPVPNFRIWRSHHGANSVDDLRIFDAQRITDHGNLRRITYQSNSSIPVSHVQLKAQA